MRHPWRPRPHPQQRPQRRWGALQVASKQRGERAAEDSAAGRTQQSSRMSCWVSRGRRSRDTGTRRLAVGDRESNTRSDCGRTTLRDSDARVCCACRWRAPRRGPQRPLGGWHPAAPDFAQQRSAHKRCPALHAPPDGPPPKVRATPPAHVHATNSIHEQLRARRAQAASLVKPAHIRGAPAVRLRRVAARCVGTLDRSSPFDSRRPPTAPSESLPAWKEADKTRVAVTGLMARAAGTARRVAPSRSVAESIVR